MLAAGYRELAHLPFAETCETRELIYSNRGEGSNYEVSSAKPLPATDSNGLPVGSSGPRVPESMLVMPPVPELLFLVVATLIKVPVLPVSFRFPPVVVGLFSAPVVTIMVVRVIVDSGMNRASAAEDGNCEGSCQQKEGEIPPADRTQVGPFRSRQKMARISQIDAQLRAASCLKHK